MVPLAGRGDDDVEPDEPYDGRAAFDELPDPYDDPYELRLLLKVVPSGGRGTERFIAICEGSERVAVPFDELKPPWFAAVFDPLEAEGGRGTYRPPEFAAEFEVCPTRLVAALPAGRAAELCALGDPA